MSSFTPFQSASDAVIAAIQPKAMALPAQTAQVWPGGATFSSIQAAMDSISGASQQEQYQIAVGPGTYNENVVMKDYVYIIGSGQSQTTITAPGQMNFVNGVINSCTGGGISDVTIIATGGTWGTCPICVKLTGAGNFHIKGVTLQSTDSGNDGNNIVCINNNAGGSQTTNLLIGQSVLQATSTGNSSTAGAIELFFGGVTTWIDLTAIEATGNAQTYGVSLAVGASCTVNDSKITANTYALYNSDGMSPITANQCVINGPVSSGVTVNN